MFFLFLFLIITFAGNVYAVSSSLNKGFLDLTNINFSEDGVINIKGEWELYDHILLKPKDFDKDKKPQIDYYFKSPGIINDFRQKEGYYGNGNGYFTYRSKIKINKNQIGKDLALKFPRISGTALKVWINDTLILQEGTPGKSKENMEPGWLPEIAEFNPQTTDLNILIQASNYYHYKSGLADEILLGTDDKIRNKRDIRLFFDILIMGSLLIVAIYHIFIYLFRPKNLSPLYFGLFSLIIALRISATGEAFLVEYFDLSYKTIYSLFLSYYLAVPVFCSFISSLYDDFSDKILKFSVITGVGFYLFSLAASTNMASYTLPFEIITILLALYCFYIIFLAVKKNKESSKLFLTAFLILFIFIFNDILYSNRIINTTYLFHIGLFIFIIFQSLVLSRNFLKAYSKVDKLSKELQRKNETLIKLDRFKDEFLADYAEKLKSPVGKIISNTKSIIHSNSNYQKNENKEKLYSIIKITQGLNYILNSFYDYLKIRKDNYEKNREIFEVKNLIKSIINLYQPFIISEEIKLITKDKLTNFKIKIDKNLLLQIYFNLLENITHYIDEGKIILGAKKTNNEIELQIEINSKNILFHSQINNLEKNKFHTNISDIRDTINLKLINLIGGNLEIKKESNKILNFKIILPENKFEDFSESKDEVNKEKNDIEQSEIKEKLILIVEYEASNTSFIKNILKKDNYSVEIMTKKEDIHNYLNDDTVLVIFNLFKIDNFVLELCAKIRDRFKSFELPILMIDSRSTPTDLMKGLEEGINDYIKKPFETSELKARMETLLTLKKRVAKSIKREQDFLRAQIKPHFLYNTLETIAYLCQKEPEWASELIINLANYLRYSFDFESLNNSIPIKNELELVDFYIKIQKARFPDKIEIEYNLKTNLDFNIPPLILQPLVENAIKHGILQEPEGGIVEITINKKNNYYNIFVKDNGIGMSEQQLLSLNNEDNKNDDKIHIGLDNINKRLKKLYNQELKIISSYGEGTTVKFKIPTNKLK